MADQLSFGQRMLAAMDARGLTQTTVAQRCGMSHSNVNHFVNDRRRPSVDNLVKLADGIGCSTDELLGRKRTDDEAIRVIGAFRYLSPAQRKCVLQLVESVAAREIHDRT